MHVMTNQAAYLLDRLSRLGLPPSISVTVRDHGSDPSLSEVCVSGPGARAVARARLELSNLLRVLGVIFEATN